MRDLILQQIDTGKSREQNLNRLRQRLQIVLLKFLHESGFGPCLAFTGGTALRLLFDLPRFSEDLDFSLVRPEKYDFADLAASVQQFLTRLDLPADLKQSEKKTVHQLQIRFQGLLYDAGLSPHQDAKLPIRFEVDTNPPAGWQTEISLLSEIYTIPVLRFDLASLFATKLHACLFRPYSKGRDYYDLMWYLGKKIQPNLQVLNCAIEQTEGKSPNLDTASLQERLLKKIGKLDMPMLRRDVAPFLLHQEEITLLDQQLMRQVISGYQF